MKAEETKQDKPGAFSRFASFVSNKLCGTDAKDREADAKSEGQKLTTMQPVQKKRDTIEDQMRLMQVKEDRQKELN